MLYFCYVINGKGSVRLENNDICRLHFTSPKESRSGFLKPEIRKFSQISIVLAVPARRKCCTRGIYFHDVADTLWWLPTLFGRLRSRYSCKINLRIIDLQPCWYINGWPVSLQERWHQNAFAFRAGSVMHYVPTFAYLFRSIDLGLVMW